MTDLQGFELLERIPAGPDVPDAVVVPSDFQLTNEDFEWLRTVANAHSGIMLPNAKRTMIYSRLAKRLRYLGLSKFSQYRAVLEGGNQEEFSEFINALTTNLTSFFREPHHFEHLRQVVLPSLLAVHRPRREVRIWSAGCSTGEEPYTLSMTVNNALAELGGGWIYRILATDLDTKVLANAASGIYPADRAAGLDIRLLRRCFLRGAGSLAGKFRIKPELQAPLSFRQLNLVKEWSMNEPFDVIFCRNVVIYFDKPTQKRLFNRFADSMVPGGYLYIGHSESLFQVTDRFELVGTTTYRKVY